MVQHCRININESSKSIRELRQSISLRYMYFSLLVTSILASLCDGNVMSSLDSAVIQIVRSSSARSDFGQQRSFGSFGAAVGTVAMSLSIQFYPQSYMSCYTGIFVAYLIFSVCLLCSGYFLLGSISFEQEEVKNEEFTKLLWWTLTQFEVIFFLITTSVNGIFQALAFTYFFVFLQALNAPSFLFGLAMTIGSGSNVLMFIYAKKCDNRSRWNL